MNAFTFATSQSITCECGTASRLASICAKQNIQSVMLITDPGIAELGIHQAALDSFTQARIAVQLFTEVKADPPESVVLDALAIAKNAQVEAIVGFGGAAHWMSQN